MHTALFKGSKVGSNAIWMAASSIARLLKGRTSICSSLLRCVSVDKPKGVSSSGKFGLDAQHKVAGLWLLVHRKFYKISTVGNHSSLF